MNYPNTYLLVGHVTKDLQPDGSFTVGGTVVYATVVVKQLGWSPVVITTAAPDFPPPAYLSDVEWRNIPSPQTTTFKNEYDSDGNRRQTIGPIAGSIQPGAIPEDCRQAHLVHFCPLAQELQPEIASVFRQSVLVATPQGWMRRWDQDGAVFLGGWDQAEEILPKLQAAVISLEDIEGNWFIAQQWAAQLPVLVVTQGAEGCTVFHQGQRQSAPPRPAQPIDPTGAGDVFAAAFFIQFYETGHLRQAARFANVTASMAIERPGPEGAPARSEIEAYMERHPL